MYFYYVVLCKYSFFLTSVMTPMLPTTAKGEAQRRSATHAIM
jgi:hypothetical protein